MQFAILLRFFRLASGLVLMAFVCTHIVNLSLGLRSLAEMEHWRGIVMAPWHSQFGEALLFGSTLVHVILGLYSLASRRSMALSQTDWVQLILGVITPPLLISHVLALRVTDGLADDFVPSYGFILSVYWSFAPSFAFQQILVVVVVWVHGALGIYSWLVLKPIWNSIKIIVLPILFAVPIMALLGFAEAGKEVLAKLASDPNWQAEMRANAGYIASVQERLTEIKHLVLGLYFALAALSISILGFKLLKNRRNLVHIAYDDDFSAKGRRGLSILEISRLNEIPHAHVCSGRGSCGTCRVRVETGIQHLSELGERERRTLAMVQAGENVRLACQALVNGSPISVTRLLPAFADAAAARAPGEWLLMPEDEVGSSHASPAVTSETTA